MRTLGHSDLSMLGSKAARLAAIGSVVAAALVVLGSPAGATSPTTPTTRYASPSGTSTTVCARTAPCDIVTAIDAAPLGSEVIIEPGTYGSATPLTTPLVDNNSDLYIHGEAGKPRPVIDSSAVDGAISVQSGSVLSQVAIHYAGPGVGLEVMGTATADHVVVEASGAAEVACIVDALLSDSLCVNSAVDASAVQTFPGDSQTGILRGVTAEETGADGAGLVLDTTPASRAAVTVSNSIIHGADVDIVEQQDSTPTGTDAATITHSDYATVTTDGGPNESVTPDHTDIKTPPRFVNAAAGNYAELASSPTVNKGSAVPFGDTDLAGNPRTMGSAPDMGAYEVAQKPVSGKSTVAAKTATTATVTVKVNPEGLPTAVHLVATAHGHPIRTSTSFLPGEGTALKTGRLTIRGLVEHTTYAIVADATNSAGKSAAARVSVKTSANLRHDRLEAAVIGATAVVTRYASPAGQISSSCPKAEPCGIVAAVSDAPAGSDVVIEPGTYGPSSNSIVDSSHNVDIHGEAGMAEPQIDSSSDVSAIQVATGSRLSDVVVDYTGQTAAVELDGGSADHIIAKTTGEDSIACDVGGALSDSVCVATASFSVAVAQPFGTDAVGSLRGVTAEATGDNGYGVDLTAPSGDGDQLTVTNSIVHGPAADLAEFSSGGTESITVTHSDYATVSTDGMAGESITPNDTDIKAAPSFAAAFENNFAEVAGSPTINKGAADPSGTDIAGFPRTMGSAPDMGAYEFLQKTVSSKPKLVTVTAHSAKLTMTVNPEGLPTTVTVVATAIYGGRVTTSPAFSAGHGTTARSVGLILAGLKRHTQYTYVVVVRSVAGRTVSPTMLFTTRIR